MARNFIGSSSQSFNASATLAGMPVTLACWFYTAGTASPTQQRLLSISNAGSFALELNNNLSAPTSIQATQRANGGGSAAAVSGAPAANVWHHAAGVFASTTSRTVYLDGVGTSNTTSVAAPSTPNAVWLGQTGAGASFYTGLLAECAVWNVALTAQEVAALAAGRLPFHVRPAALVAYWPLWGLVSNEPDFSGNAATLTNNNGATAANHAPVTLFTRKRSTFTPLASTSPSGRILQPLIYLPPLPAAFFE